METWKEGSDCCSWNGVTCDRVRGDVIGLDLSCSRLKGTIPSNSNLFLLPHLQLLNLAFNDFNYSLISSGFGQFPRLRYLNLSHSYFFGQVPIELSHLSQLASLDLSSSYKFQRRSDYERDGENVPLVMLQTSVVKSLLQNLTKLRELHLDHVDMSSVSLSSFMNLSSSLTSLSLQDCQLRGTLPDVIFRLPNLRELSLNDNFELKALFPMVNWTNPLRFLDVSHTLFSGELPKSIGNLKFLSYLGLSSCNFSKSLPATVGNLTQLTFFDLSSNSFSGEIPSSVSNLKALDFFDLQSNNLNGSIPASIGNVTKVTQFYLCSNNFTGQIPSSLSNLKDLTIIDFRDNSFGGSIPASIGNVTKVTQIFLQSNKLIGQIPSSLLNLKDLYLIDLSYNNFTGRIPDFLTNLTKLYKVDLSYNQLTQIGEFQPSNSLKILTLNNNKLYGSIPKSISNLVNLTKLDISSNDLSGIVEFDKSTKPSELQILDLSYNSRLLGIKSNFNDTFPALRSLNVVSCNITEFPNFLKSSKNLERLDLSHNFLSRIDQLPLKNLWYLDLRANLLQGKLPAPPDSIVIFLISNNILIGGIPSMICNASSLRVLDISRNRLGGTVPQCLGNFSNDLVVMDLRMNNFNGTIPDTFVKDNRLTTLVFNGNQLEGQLPKSLVNCAKLEVLDLGNNKIIDFFPSWLEALPELKVLVLKSNRFHGPIGNHKSSGEFFTKLRILDLSHNEFTGPLPRNYFQNLNAMMTIEGEYLQYLGESNYYQDSVVVTQKGSEIELQRILNIFTTIDLSSNKFEEKIPEVLGRLTILRLLNLSHNGLTGHIPLSLANLSGLESIDLSSNKLTGEIPMQLTSLTFLAMLNLSQNQLIGPIPKGKQFDTFENDSYYGNLGLCGLPLSIKCRTDASPLPSPSIFQGDNDSMFASGFGWKAVLMGYGCGFVFGLAMGYVFWFKTEKPQWLVRFFNGGNGKTGWPNNQRPRRRRS